MAVSNARPELGDFSEFFKRQNILIIEGRYYEDIGKALLEGATSELASLGVSYSHVTVPGALEIPQVLNHAVESGVIGIDGEQLEFSGAIALGCVIRGETYHFDIVCNETNRMLMDICRENYIPVGNAILTVETHSQALKRARGQHNGKGGEAARACLKIIELAAKFKNEIY